MASAEDEIKVEVQRLLNLAKRLVDVAQSLKEVIGDDYASSISELQKYWGGENAAAVVAVSKKIGEGAAETISKIVEAARMLQAEAEEFARAEINNINKSK